MRKTAAFLISLMTAMQVQAQTELNPIDPNGGKDPVRSEEIREEERAELQEKRFEALKEEAEDGNLEAIREMGANYYFGRLGVDKDLVEAARWWKMGADKRERQCMFNLANLYFKGTGVEKNLEKAASLYAGSADLGLPLGNINAGQAFDRLAEVSLSKKGTKEEEASSFKKAQLYYKEARRYLREASLMRNFKAMVRFAEYCELGLGGKVDMLTAVTYFRECARSGDANSQLKMAHFCQNENLDKVYNPQEALRWVMLSADNGNSAAQAQVGYLFQQGIGVAQDFEIGYRWYLLAANKGFAPAQVAVANCLMKGAGVGQDVDKAFRWYQRAALLKSPIANYNLGVCYYMGRGVPKNKERGLKFYTIAADLGQPQAQYVLGTMYLEGKDVAKDERKAVVYIQQAALAKHAGALYQLGRCYLEGIVVKKNLLRAEESLEMASALNSREAFDLLQKKFKKRN